MSRSTDGNGACPPGDEGEHETLGTMDITNIRQRLDGIDRRIVSALAERQRIVDEAAAIKAQKPFALRDGTREDEILTRVGTAAVDLGLDTYFVTSLYREILDHSVRRQATHLVGAASANVVATPVRIGYQGSAGAYSEIAARRHFSSHEEALDCLGYTTFDAVLEAVRGGEVAYGILPIENTTAGSINEVYDLFARLDVHAVGEEILRVDHCLVALEPMAAGELRCIASHPQALAQCSEFLASLKGCRVEAYTDTAMAVEKIKEDCDRRQAAIASEAAARLNGLQIIQRDLANQRHNYTRFLVIAREPNTYDDRIPCKTSLIVGTRHEEGALVRCLNVLAKHGLSLTKLESRPRRTPWEYLFYLDFFGNIAQPAVHAALEELAPRTSFLKVLGSYPSHAAETTALRGTTGAVAKEIALEPEPQVTANEDEGPATSQAAKKEGLGRSWTGGSLRLVPRARCGEDTSVLVGNVVIGADAPVLIAGPCSVESRAQILACARAVRETGGRILRGGCFKPRTSPYSFQGLGYEGLELLAEAGRAYGLPVVTEVLRPDDVARVSRLADMLQIGARNMQNFPLLEEVGKVDRPVLLKRGMMSSIDEWLSAAEYILAKGNRRVVLCERGIRTFETATRATLDLTAIPVVLERTHLPVIVDPSHACGVRRWVPALARASLASGAHGLIVEVHPDPDVAQSDAGQALDFEGLDRMVKGLPLGD